MDLLRQLLDRFGDRMELVLVLSENRRERFQLLEESGLKSRAEAAGAPILAIRKLDDDSMRRIDARGVSFWAALTPADHTHAALGLLERRRVRSRMERNSKEFNRVGV